MMRRRAGTFVCAALVIGFACSRRSGTAFILPTGAITRHGDLTMRPVRFEAREKSAGTAASEGFLRVPQSRDGRDTTTLTVHFVRFGATVPGPASPIVYLAGGPGGSGTYSASGDRYDFFQALRAAGDVIAFDQRGVFGSDPYLVCPESWALAPDDVASPDALDRALAPWVEGCFAHWSARGVDLSAYNTVESARDLEDLRTALGAERLLIVAISYGTHLALEFARQFPNSVERMVLAGVEGPDHTWKRPSDVDAALARVEDFANRRLGFPGLRDSIRTLLERLRANVVSVPVRDPATGERLDVMLGPLDAQLAIYDHMNERDDLPDLVLGLRAALAGDYALFARAIQPWRTGIRGLAMTIAMDCASGVSAARRAVIEREQAHALLGPAPNVVTDRMCAHWPSQPLPPAFRTPVASSVPALVISGMLDGRTPVEQAEEVLEGLSNGSHVRIMNGGHDDDLLIGSPEIADVIVQFLKGQTPSRSVIVLR